MASHKDIQVRNELIGNELIKFDRDILNLALRNLISNAIKFSFKGGEIIISSKQTSKNYVIHVTDFGVGMSPEVLDSLRNSKQVGSMSGTGNEKGTGLGLSLCREYLRAVDAQLEIDSMVGKGSVFSISIPKRYFFQMHQDSLHLDLTAN
jgi:signal transduction histidine kinase